MYTPQTEAELSMIGKIYGRLKVVSFHGKNKHGSRLWDCLCDCGDRTIVSTNTLNMGNTKSCGCLLKDTTRSVHSKHGLHDHPLYGVWGSMKSRCYNPTDLNYRHYGGRGIRICSEWLQDFSSFYDWAMRNGYSPGLSIDRYPDNNGDYTPGNCRWSTRQEQMQNTRNTVLSEEIVKSIREDTRSDKELAEIYKVNMHTIYQARRRMTWSNI